MKLLKYIITCVLLLTTLIPIYFLINNLQPLVPALYGVTVVCLIGIVLFIKIFASNFLLKLEEVLRGFIKYKRFMPVSILTIVLVGILVRFYFYFRLSYTPVSDAATFVNAANKVASGNGLLGDFNSGFFPYLTAYENILGNTMKIVHNPWLATILLNTIFDLGSAVVLYFLIRRLSKPNSVLPILIFAVWFLSPLNIAYSIISLPVIIVNFFIIASIFIVCVIFKQIKQGNITGAVALSLLLGLVMGYGNCFRPLFPIFIIALLLLLIYVFITTKITRRLALLLGLVLFISTFVFLGTQKINTAVVSSEVGYSVPTNPSGWSIYVGSNQPNGSWTPEEVARMNVMCKDFLLSRDYAACHKKLEKAGIQNYKDYGPWGTVSLFTRKAMRFAGDQTLMYNDQESVTGYTTSKAAKTINIYMIIFVLTLYILAAYFLYTLAKGYHRDPRIEPIVLFMVILLVGMSLSFLSVESAPRYATILYPVFTIFAVLSLERVKSNNLRKVS